jgi:K(+)-stimulated pyrophosphate-energized sodium pump
MAPILLPMFIAGVGILFSIVGTLFVRISDTAKLDTQSSRKPSIWATGDRSS